MNPEEQNTDQVLSPTSEHSEPETETKTSELKEHRTFAILGYILPFLFFLPLLDDKSKNVPFVRFHANQQLILLIIAFGVYVVHNVLYITMMFGGLMFAQILNLGLLVLALYGIHSAYKEEEKELPLVGHFRILK